jgi:hypothetical protein
MLTIILTIKQPPDVLFPVPHLLVLYPPSSNLAVMLMPNDYCDREPTHLECPFEDADL